MGIDRAAARRRPAIDGSDHRSEGEIAPAAAQHLPAPEQAVVACSGRARVCELCSARRGEQRDCLHRTLVQWTRPLVRLRRMGETGEA